MSKCPASQNARSHKFDENDTITFLFNEPVVALSYLTDAGLFKASHI